MLKIIWTSIFYSGECVLKENIVEDLDTSDRVLSDEAPSALIDLPEFSLEEALQLVGLDENSTDACEVREWKIHKSIFLVLYCNCIILQEAIFVIILLYCQITLLIYELIKFIVVSITLTKKVFGSNIFPLLIILLSENF